MRLSRGCNDHRCSCERAERVLVLEDVGFIIENHARSPPTFADDGDNTFEKSVELSDQKAHKRDTKVH